MVWDPPSNNNLVLQRNLPRTGYRRVPHLRKISRREASASKDGGFARGIARHQLTDRERGPARLFGGMKPTIYDPTMSTLEQ